MSTALAAVDITYTFDQSAVQIYGYDCLDDACGSVRDFSGEFTTSNPTTNGRITARYPDSPATPYRYAFFFVSPGYRPIESRANVHSNGNPNVFEQTIDIDFTKVETCRAQVSDFSVLNNVRANIPVVVDISASLDATTASAFEKVDNQIAFIPQEIIDQYYSADTRVSLQIYRNGQLVDTLVQELTAENGNPIFADSSRRVEFTYLPRIDGSYEARVVAEVIDPMCQSTEEQSSSSQFNVLPEEPLDQCYTILNNLDISNTHPRLGEQLVVTFDKTSNYVDSTGVLTPIQTDVDILVTDAQGNTLFTRSGLTYVANPDSINPVEQTFTFEPTAIGAHTITVTGASNDIMCQSKQNHAQSVSMNFFVDDTYSGSDLTLRVRDREDRPVSGAEVDIDGVGEVNTDGSGQAVFSLMPGTYQYEVKRDGYLPKSGRFTMGNGEKNLIVYLTAGEYEEPDNVDDDDLDDALNSNPRLDLPSEVFVIVGQTKVMALDNYADDAQDGPQDLSFSFDIDNSSAISMIVEDGVARIEATSAGSTEVEVTVTDRGGRTDRDTFTITAIATNTAPVFQALPDIVLSEDTHFFRALYLPAFVNDSDTPDSDLSFTLTLNNSRAGIVINNGYVEVNPSRDFFGTVSGTVTVSDGANQDSTSLTVIINGTPDAPIIQRIPNIGNIPPGQNFTINLSEIVLDPDQTNLSFAVINNENGLGFVIEETLDLLTLILGTTIHQNTQFTLAINNSNGQMVLLENVTLDLTSVNDAPFFTQVIPDIAVQEHGQASLDLTPYEDDQEDGPGDNNNALTWTIVNSNASNMGVTFDSAQDYLVVSPQGDFFGAHVLQLILSDSQGLNASQNITVNVANVQDAPVLSPIPDASVEAGEAFVIQVNATDVDLEVLTFTSSNSNITIASATGLINFTPVFLGAQNTQITVCDPQAACDSDNFTLTVVDTTPPSNITSSAPNATLIYDPLLVVPLTVSFVDNDGIASVDVLLNGAVYAGSNVTQSGPFDYAVNLTGLSSGFYEYQWQITDNGNNTNTSSLSNFTIQKANSTGMLLLDGSASNIAVADNTSVVINASIDVPANASFNVSIDGLLVQSANSSVVFNSTFTGEGSTHPVLVAYSGNENYTSFVRSLNVTVNDVTPPVFSNVTLVPASGLLPQSSYNFSVVVTDNVAVSDVILEIDGVNQTNLTQSGSIFSFITSSLGVGNHTYRFHANDTSANVNSTSLFNYSVLADIVAPSITNLSVVPTNGSLFGVVANFSASITDNALIDTVTFEFDGANYTNLSSSQDTYYVTVGPLAAGSYPYRWIANDSSGNTNASMLQTYVVGQQTTNLSLSLSPANSVTFGQQTNVSCTSAHPIVSNLTRNGSIVVNPDVQNLAAGSYAYVCATAGNTNYTAASVNQTLTVLAASQNGTTSIGGQSGDAAVIVNQTIPFVINNTVGTNNMSAYLNGSLVASGTGPLLFNQTFNTTGVRTLTVVFEANQNYSETNITRTISVLPNALVQKFNLTPASGSVVNSSFILSFDTINATQCRANALDTNYSQMTILLDSSPTTQHNGSIFIPFLGPNAAVHVACVGENSTNNLDLVYDVQNIIVSSAVSDSALNNSFVNMSTVQVDSLLQDAIVQDSFINFSSIVDTNVTRSNVTGSTLNNCRVVNSTVKNIAASDCVIENSYADPPTPNVDLSGSTITGDSSIIRSNVTYSTVDDSNITDSDINGSSVQSCSLLRVIGDGATFVGCALEDATVTPGTIINGTMITTGTINSTVFYNATANGPANLSDLVNYAPIAGFTASATSITSGGSVSFTSTSSDVNIGGALNDSLQFYYDFGDGSNATSANTSHTFSSVGSFSVNLTVTDAYNKSSSSTSVISVVAASSGGGSSGGSGGGGSGSSGRSSSGGSSGGSFSASTGLQLPTLEDVELTLVPKTFTFAIRTGVAFERDGVRHVVFLESADPISFVVDNESVSVWDSVDVNLDESAFEELRITILDVHDGEVRATLNLREESRSLDLSGTILDMDLDEASVDLEFESSMGPLDRLREWVANSSALTQALVVFIVVMLGLALYGLAALLVR